MPTPTRTSSLMKPWAWLAAIAAVCLVLASSTALYVLTSGVRLGLPWWTAVAAPVVVYALVLPLCIPRIRLGGWLAGFFTLVVLHGLLGLATTWLYAHVGFTSFGEALAPAFWRFPPALVLEMVGALLMTLPFMGMLAPRPAAPRVAPEPALPRDAVSRKAAGLPAPPDKGHQAWARPAKPAEPAVAPVVATLVSAVAPPVIAAAPVIEERPVAAPEPMTVHAAPLSGTNGAPPEIADDTPEAVPDFRQALSELFETPAPATQVEERVEPPRAEPVAEAPVSESPRTVTAPPVEVAPAVPEVAAPGTMVRIPFDRVVGQLPPGAFRVPLLQVGARLREPETLLVPRALIVPQLGEGVVQVAWETVAEQFPAAVFAVPPAEVKERIVNGRLLLPLDEIVKQLPPDVFGASMGRGPVAVPGIEGFPAPFKPLGEEGPAPLTEPAPLPKASAVAPLTEPAPLSIEMPSAAELAEDLKWTPPSGYARFDDTTQVIEPPRAEPPVTSVELPPVVASMPEATAEPEQSDVAEPAIRIPFDRVAAQFPAGAFRVPLAQVGVRLSEAGALMVTQALVLPQLAEGVVHVAWDDVVGQFPPEIFAAGSAGVRDLIEGGWLSLPLDEIVRQLPPDVFGAAMARGPVHVPGIESFPAPFKPLGHEEPAAVVPEPAQPGPAPEPVRAEPAIEIAAAAPVPAFVEPAIEVAAAAPEPVRAEPAIEIAAAAPVPAFVEPAIEIVAVAPAPAPVEIPLEVAAPQPVPIAPLYEAQVYERPLVFEAPAPAPPPVQPDRRDHVGSIAALVAPLEAAALVEVRVGDFTIIGVSTAGMAADAVTVPAGRLGPVIARAASPPIDQVTLRGAGGMLVLTPVGSGWSSGTVLAVGMRSGGTLARLEMLARRAAAGHDLAPSPTPGRGAAPFARLDAAPTPPALAAAALALTTFGPLAAQSYREPASGTVVHCLVSPGVSAADLAPFACELAQVMALGAPAEPLGAFHSAVLHSGSTRVEIRRLPTAAGAAPILVVGGSDGGRPGLARLQIERTAARLTGA